MNKRIWWACQAVFVDGTYLDNVQTVGIDSSIPTQEMFDNGRSQLFRQFEQKPEVSITIERQIKEGFVPFYTPASASTYSNSYILKDGNIGSCGWDGGLKTYLIEISYCDDSDLSSATDIDNLKFKYCIPTEISYSLGVDVNWTESVSLVTHNFIKEVSESVPLGGDSGTLMRRSFLDTQNSKFLLPTEVEAAIKVVEDGTDVRLIQSIEIATSFSHEEMSDTGKWRGSNQAANPTEQNKWKFVQVPLETTCSITAVVRKSLQQDIRIKDTNFTATAGKCDRQIRIIASSGSNKLVWDLGDKNYLTSVSFSGGDTGGGNLEATFSYANKNNDFVPYTNSTVYEYTTAKL